MPAEVSLWRFDGAELNRIPLPDTPLSGPSGDTVSPGSSVFVQDAYYLEGDNNDLYVRHNLRFTTPPSSSYRWRWSDGFSARAFTPHPAMTTPLQRVGDATYAVTDGTLWRVNGREDRVEALATLPAGELFFALDQRRAGLILWTLGGTPQAPRISQWQVTDEGLAPLASLPVDAGLSAPLPLDGEALSLAARVYNGALYLVADAADGVPTLYQSRDGETVAEIAPACGADEFIYPQWVFDASPYIRATGCLDTGAILGENDDWRDLQRVDELLGCGHREARTTRRWCWICPRGPTWWNCKT